VCQQWSGATLQRGIGVRDPSRPSGSGPALLRQDELLLGLRRFADSANLITL
jgi:hypothetical protein